jgi:hypothetical protein
MRGTVPAAGASSMTFAECARAAPPKQPEGWFAARDGVHLDNITLPQRLVRAADRCSLRPCSLADASGNLRPGIFFGFGNIFIVAMTHSCGAVSTGCCPT